MKKVSDCTQEKREVACYSGLEVLKFVVLKHFQMETLHSIAEALQPQEFLTSMNLTDAYLHIPIWPGHH